ncbi:MAG: hypothetical protein Q7S04_03060 [Candidatus Moranbacteria bacterium]|nr:hypothetical protein [Candidatus Moranbacteria bacterium]
MRLKVLIPPFLIVMILILSIGFIKPDIEVLQAKKTDILVKKTMVANVDAVIADIGTLNSSLDAKQDFEKFVYRYLPSTQNQEQAIDAFNFFAMQSGVVITKMDLKQPLVQNMLSEEGNGETSDLSQKPALSVAKTFTFSGSVIGSYENIKAFFNRLVHMERFQKISFFSIATDTNTESLDTSHLVGEFETELGYLPPEPLATAINTPIFLNSQFDFSNVSKSLERVTGAMPVLEKGPTGRPNPFQ